VLINLLGNAIKFTEHGEVCLRVAYRDGVLQLRVSDSGLGIDPAQHEEIFKPFAQTGESRYKVQGTGLGLAITRKILEVMRGTITLHSELGKGTCFEVAIPLAASDDVLPPPSSREPVDSDIIGYCSPLGDVRILLVDDVADNRLVLQQLLEPLGFNISQADSGEQCLQQLSSLNPHLILMDLRMPGIDGLETTRRIHNLAEFATLPIISISASNYAEDRIATATAGCITHLAKPVQRDTLLETLRQSLPLHWVKNSTATPVTPPPNTVSMLNDTQCNELRDMLDLGDVGSIIEYLKDLLNTPDCPVQAKELLTLAQTFQLSKLHNVLGL
jgi:CheY-like chemotaxis protein